MTKFLIIRYAPGAAGKILICLLGCHPEIASWNNSNLSNHNWAKIVFKKDFENWLNREPKNPWNMQQYVSATYSRGDDIDELPIDFSEKWIPITWHKNYLGKFIKKYHTINIIINKSGARWYHRSRWKKHFKVEKNNSNFLIYQQQHRNSYQIQNFNNQYIIEVKNLFSFIKNNVINYKENFNFLTDDDLKPSSNIFLSDLLSWSTTKKSLEKISIDLDLSEFNWEEVKDIWNHWRSMHDY